MKGKRARSSESHRAASRSLLARSPSAWVKRRKATDLEEPGEERIPSVPGSDDRSVRRRSTALGDAGGEPGPFAEGIPAGGARTQRILRCVLVRAQPVPAGLPRGRIGKGAARRAADDGDLRDCTVEARFRDSNGPTTRPQTQHGCPIDALVSRSEQYGEIRRKAERA